MSSQSGVFPRHVGNLQLLHVHSPNARRTIGCQFRSITWVGGLSIVLRIPRTPDWTWLREAMQQNRCSVVEASLACSAIPFSRTLLSRPCNLSSTVVRLPVYVFENLAAQASPHVWVTMFQISAHPSSVCASFAIRRRCYAKPFQSVPAAPAGVVVWWAGASINHSSRNLLLSTLHQSRVPGHSGPVVRLRGRHFPDDPSRCQPSAHVSSCLIPKNVASSEDLLLSTLNELRPSFIHARRLIEVPAARFSRATDGGRWQSSRSRLHPRDQPLEQTFQLHLDRVIRADARESSSTSRIWHASARWTTK